MYSAFRDTWARLISTLEQSEGYVLCNGRQKILCHLEDNPLCKVEPVLLVLEDEDFRGGFFLGFSPHGLPQGCSWQNNRTNRTSRPCHLGSFISFLRIRIVSYQNIAVSIRLCLSKKIFFSPLQGTNGSQAVSLAREVSSVSIVSQDNPLGRLIWVGVHVLNSK